MLTALLVSGGLAVARCGVIVHTRNARILTIDTIAQEVIGMPPGARFRARKEPCFELLDERGRPMRPGAGLEALKPSVPAIFVRAFRWEAAQPWRWVVAHAQVDRQREELVRVLVQPLPEPHPRPRGWDCAACSRRVTATAEHRGRALCLECWVAAT